MWELCHYTYTIFSPCNMIIGCWLVLIAFHCVQTSIGKEILELDDLSFKSALEADREKLWLIYFHAVSGPHQ